jgi:hypothetical protein
MVEDAESTFIWTIVGTWIQAWVMIWIFCFLDFAPSLSRSQIWIMILDFFVLGVLFTRDKPGLNMI